MYGRDTCVGGKWRKKNTTFRLLLSECQSSSWHQVMKWFKYRKGLNIIIIWLLNINLWNETKYKANYYPLQKFWYFLSKTCIWHIQILDKKYQNFVEDTMFNISKFSCRIVFYVKDISLKLYRMYILRFLSYLKHFLCIYICVYIG